MKVLISGAGIAGPCLAFWLRRYGFEPTIVERAPRLRTGGYVVDFWGEGFDVAERMGIAPRIRAKGYHVEELQNVDSEGRKESAIPISVFDDIAEGKLASLPRSDLAASVFEALGDDVETIFGQSILAIDPTDSAVRVHFEHGTSREFDLVVGADGLHSQVRKLVFGDETRFEHYLGFKVAAFVASGYRPRDERNYVVHTELGRQCGRFALHGDDTLFLFVFRDTDPELPNDIAAQRALLHDRYADCGWECPHILDVLDRSDDLYLDRVSQIRMESWTQGRVALVGDAAFCISLLGGQGSALAMVAAYVLAGELKVAKGDHTVAFRRYQERLGDLIAGKQKSAIRLAPFFAPKSRLGMFVRNQAVKLMAVPFVESIAAAHAKRERIDLPRYH